MGKYGCLTMSSDNRNLTFQISVGEKWKAIEGFSITDKF